MPSYTDARRGYAAPTLQRDEYLCAHCGLDGKVWPSWLYLSWDHLLPDDNPLRDDHEYNVAACTSCNTFANRTVFDLKGKMGCSSGAMPKASGG